MRDILEKLFKPTPIYFIDCELEKKVDERRRMARKKKARDRWK